MSNKNCDEAVRVVPETYNNNISGQEIAYVSTQHVKEVAAHEVNINMELEKCSLTPKASSGEIQEFNLMSIEVTPPATTCNTYKYKMDGGKECKAATTLVSYDLKEQKLSSDVVKVLTSRHLRVKKSCFNLPSLGNKALDVAESPNSHDVNSSSKKNSKDKSKIRVGHRKKVRTTGKCSTDELKLDKLIHMDNCVSPKGKKEQYEHVKLINLKPTKMHASNQLNVVNLRGCSRRKSETLHRGQNNGLLFICTFYRRLDS